MGNMGLLIIFVKKKDVKSTIVADRIDDIT
jgi:hypothetical protein